MILNRLNKKALLLITIVLMHVNTVHAKDEHVRIRNIEEISLDEIGILNGNSGGLRKHIWQESSRSFIESMLVTMPVTTEQGISNKLSKLIILSKATPPRSKKKIVSSIFDVKLKKLAMIGDYANIARMISQVPSNRVTEDMHRVYVASFFMDNQYIKGCDETENYLKKYPSVFWSKTHIICNAYNNKKGKLDFNIKLLKEQGHELDKKYSDIVELFKTNKKDKAKQAWAEIVKNDILSLPEIINSIPAPEYVLRSHLNKQKLVEWLQNNRKEQNEDKKLQSIISTFSNIEALGTPITIDTWRQFIMYAISKKLTIPKYAAYRILKQTPSDGERILTILHILEEEETNEIPQYLFTQMVYSLNKMGFVNEAVKLAESRL